MKAFYYSFLHMKAKKVHTTILMFLFLFLSLLLLAGAGIYHATNKSIQELEESLGGSFTITTKYYTKEQRPDLYKSHIWLDGKEYYEFCNKVAITDELVDKIMQLGGIEKYNKESGVFAYLGDYTLKGGLSTESMKISQSDKGYEKLYGPTDTYSPKITFIYTTDDSNLYSYFRNGTLTLTQGRNIQKGDRFKVVVSEYFANQNNLKIGDKMVASLYKDFYTVDQFEIEKNSTLEIVGIFKVNTIQGDLEYVCESDILENIMFSDFDMEQSAYDCGLYKKEVESSKSIEYVSATFFVKDPKQLNTIIGNVKKSMGKDLEYWDIKKDDTNYKSSVEPLIFMKKIIVVSLVIVCGTCVILLSLLSTMWMLERKKEISILLSLGKSKAVVILHFLLEYLILATVAIVLAFFLSLAVSNKMGNQLLDFVSPKEKVSTESSSLDVNNYVDEAGNVDLVAIGNDAIAFETPSQTPDSINISIGVREFAMVFGIEWTILGSSILRMGNRLWKMSPRQIISDLG